MKLSHVSIGLLALFSPLASAWSKEDREIFRIRDEITAHETDPAASFYDILGVAQSASLDDINKAFRQKTRLLHPDKVTAQLRAERAKKAKEEGVAPKKQPSQSEIGKAVQEASDRQARLSLIVNILRSEGRDRYNHFLSNGFPLWKGTDYYYNRYRPGLGSAMIGIFLLGGGGMHYIALYMAWKRQKEFVQRYIKFARDTAWGPNMVVPGLEPEPAPTPPEEEEAPQAMNRKQRRMQEQEKRREDSRGGRKKAVRTQSATASRDESAAPTGPRKKVVAQNGKVLIVDAAGNVYLEDQDGEGNVNEFLLDPNELAKPGITDTAVVRAPLWLFNSTVGRLLPKGSSHVEVDSDLDEDSDGAQATPETDSAGEDFEVISKSTDSLAKAKTSGAAQQGGRANKRKNRKR